MKFKVKLGKWGVPFRAGFSMIEVTVCIAVVGIIAGAALSGLTHLANHLRISREHARATQIIMQKLEEIRLTSWDHLNDSTKFSRSFTAYYDPSQVNTNDTPTTAGQVVYQGSVSVNNMTSSETYKSDMKKVTLTLQWSSRGRAVQSQISTIFAKYGVQSYYAF